MTGGSDRHERCANPQLHGHAAGSSSLIARETNAHGHNGSSGLER